MNNTDILELKKRFKKDNTITRIQGCYVLGMEKKIQWNGPLNSRL